MENIMCSSSLQAALLFRLVGASLGGIRLMLLFCLFSLTTWKKILCFMCSAEFLSSFKVMLLALR